MGQLTDDLAAGLDIRYGTFVTEIAYSGDKVSVFTKNTAEVDGHRSCVACHTGTDASSLNHDNVYTADRVVVALPLGMLKNEGVRFNPALPQDKLTAIDALGIGTMNKVFLRFPDNFWQENGYFFEYLKEDHSKIIEFFSPTPTGTENIIVAVLAGQHARSMEKMEDDEVRTMVMDDLRGMFGSGIPQPVDMKRTAWHTNPLSLGSYPHLKPGADLTACDEIALPLDNKVFFAGDATSSKYMATAHGAYISGMNAAEAIILLNS
jgi:monoamine oxidase